MIAVLLNIFMISALALAIKIYRKKYKRVEDIAAASSRAVRWYQELENADIYTKAEQLPKWRNFVMSLPGQQATLRKIR